MRVRWKTALAALAGLASTVTVHAQVVGSVGLNTYQAVDGLVTIPLGTVSVDTDVLIFDSTPDGVTGLPNESVRQITISGAVQSGTTPRVRILVAKANSVFPGLPIQTVDAGLVDIGDPNNPGNSGIDIPDPTLRDATVLAVSVTGNIYGAINCGRVFRIQAINPQFDNEISANITATARDGATDPSIADATYAINVIRAGNGISGKIEARGERIGDDQIVFPGSIGRVSVGPGPDPLLGPPIGIQGDIIASADGSARSFRPGTSAGPRPCASGRATALMRSAPSMNPAPARS